MNSFQSSLPLSAAAGSGTAAAVLPKLPGAFKYGTGCIIDDVIYLGLGSLGASWYKLDLTKAEPSFEELAPFAGPVREQAQAAAVNGRIYVFGGCGRLENGLTGVLNDVWCYDVADNSWSKCMTRAPFGLCGHSALTLDGKSILVTGSVNKAIFDGFFEDMAAVEGNDALKASLSAAYTGRRVEDYCFNAAVLTYCPECNAWGLAGTLPFGGRAGAALAAVDGKAVLIGGEKKPGLRSACTLALKQQGADVSFESLPDLPCPEGDEVHEGVAGAFAGTCGSVLLCAGGANFPGSTKAYAGGKLFAHQGLKKTYRKEIYALVDGQWQIAGELPYGAAYGLSITRGSELWVVGGELADGSGSSDIVLLSFKDGRAVVR